MRIALVNPTWSFESSIGSGHRSPHRPVASGGPGAEVAVSRIRPHSRTFRAQTDIRDSDPRRAPPAFSRETDRLGAQRATHLRFVDETMPRGGAVAFRERTRIDPRMPGMPACVSAAAGDATRTHRARTPLAGTSPACRPPGEPDGEAWERAHTHHPGQFDRFGDIPSERPAPLRELEAACCPA